MSSSAQNIVVRKIAKDDLHTFMEVITLFVNVFERDNFSMPDSNHLQKLLEKDDFFVFCAMIDSKVIGGITIYVQEQYYSTKPLAYIYDLAVDNEYQRQGIGRSLIDHINSFCKQHGFEETYVPAEKEDLHAIDFYRSTKPTYEADVIHFSYVLDSVQKT